MLLSKTRQNANIFLYGPYSICKNQKLDIFSCLSSPSRQLWYGKTYPEIWMYLPMLTHITLEQKRYKNGGCPSELGIANTDL